MAELECGHNQHVRHRPPFQWREWVVEPRGREARLGSRLPCPLCDRAELPDTVRSMRVAEWDESSLPAGLRRAHRLGRGTWGRIVVDGGRLRFRAATTPPIEIELEAGGVQMIPPEVEHEVEPNGPVRFSLEFFAVERSPCDLEGGLGPADLPDEPADPACWAGLVCPECGGVIGDGSGHRPGCVADDPRS